MNGSAHKRTRTWAQRTLPLCLCCLLAGTAALPAFAQSQDVINRIDRLENELDTLNRAVYKGEKPPVSPAAQRQEADMLVRLQQLESQLRDLTGKVEQQSYDTQQLQMKVDALEQDSRMRLDAVESQLRGNPSAAAAPVHAPAAASPAESAVEMPPQPAQPQPQATSILPGSAEGMEDAAALYEKGFGEIKSQDYGAAEKTFASFLKTYPDHALAPNALYWLGETFYVRGQYDKAARTFAESYQKYPKGPKGADNLLKLGMSLAGAGKKKDACIALGQLKREYPKGPPPVLNKGDQEMTNLGCS